MNDTAAIRSAGRPTEYRLADGTRVSGVTSILGPNRYSSALSVTSTTLNTSSTPTNSGWTQVNSTSGGQTNVVGTLRLLNCARLYWTKLPELRKAAFRFLHVSTDEVYGTLSLTDPAFTELTPFAPNSPYAASKASSDHLVRSFQHTYHFPTLTTNCSNNYGPYHFPEKLIPLVILNALEGKNLPVYGDGMQVRDWLYVTDHCSAIRRTRGSWLRCGVPRRAGRRCRSCPLVFGPGDRARAPAVRRGRRRRGFAGGSGGGGEVRRGRRRRMRSWT